MGSPADDRSRRQRRTAAARAHRCRVCARAQRGHGRRIRRLRARREIRHRCGASRRERDLRRRNSGRIVERRGASWRDDYRGERAAPSRCRWFTFHGTTRRLISPGFRSTPASAIGCRARPNSNTRCAPVRPRAIRGATAIRTSPSGISPAKAIVRRPSAAGRWRFRTTAMATGVRRRCAVPRRCVRTFRHGRQRVGMGRGLLARQLRARAARQQCVGRIRLRSPRRARRIVGQRSGPGAFGVPHRGRVGHTQRCASDSASRAISELLHTGKCVEPRS